MVDCVQMYDALERTQEIAVALLSLMAGRGAKGQAQLAPLKKPFRLLRSS